MTLQTNSLDGRRFDGVVLEPGKVAGDAERISFTKGLFHSTACDAYGYVAGPYSASADGILNSAAGGLSKSQCPA